MSCNGTTRTRRRLALLVDSLEDEFQTALFRAVRTAAQDHELDLIVLEGGALGRPEPNPRSFVFDLLTPKNVDAVLLSSNTVGCLSPPSQMQQLIDRFAPVPRLSLGLELQGVPALLVDNEAGMYEVVMHLVRVHGHRRIALVSGPGSNLESDARLRGYRRALAESGIPLDPALEVEGDFLRPAGGRAVAQLLDRRAAEAGSLDAIVFANDHMALGGLDELARRRVRVPRQLAVASFDDIEDAHLARVPLTSVRQPLGDLAREAVRRLARALAGHALEPEVVSFPTQLMVRRSCGCSARPYQISRSTQPVEAGGDLLEQISARLPAALADMSRAARGELDALPGGWEQRLGEAFAKQLTGAGEEFFGAIEDALQDLLGAGASLSAFEEALLVLRRGTVGWARRDSEVSGRAYELAHEALLMVHDAEAVSQALQRQALQERTLGLGGVTATLMAAPDLATLARATGRELPRLGIRSTLVGLFTRPGEMTPELEVAVAFDQQQRKLPVTRYPTAMLAPEGFLDGRVVVVEPLSFHGERLGVALFEYGPSDGVVYTHLRLSVSAALKAAQLARAIEDAHRKIEQLAIRDPLTGVYNRRHLTERLEAELAFAGRHGHRLSVAIIDLDNFKLVNDRHGHAAGDEVLKRVASIIVGAHRVEDTVARLGGDEFVVLHPMAAASEALAAAQRLLASLTDLDEEGLVSASIGVATYDPTEPALDSDELLRRADDALLHAKQAGKRRALHWESLTRLA